MASNPFSRFDSFAPGKKANRFAVGNRTYNGFSPSPQAGPGSVNPAGYQERESKAKTKRRLLTKQIGGK